LSCPGFVCPGFDGVSLLFFLLEIEIAFMFRSQKIKDKIFVCTHTRYSDLYHSKLRIRIQEAKKTHGSR
jgi:hypothetical protein